MFAVLKNPEGLPCALFEIERETSKRYYGRLADTINEDRWFWLTGLTRGHRHLSGTKQDHASKDIVVCTFESMNAWHMMKDAFVRIKAEHRARNTVIQGERIRYMQRIREQELDSLKRARYDAMDEMEKYIDKDNMF